MSSPQEQAARDDAPQLITDHVARYRLLDPLLGSTDAWFDLGCGSGKAAQLALSEPFNGELTLIDHDSDALQTASELFPASTTPEQLQLDLNQDSAAETLAKRIGKVGRKKSILLTCFELLPQLESFEPLLRVLTEIGEDRDVTVLLSVPNGDYVQSDDKTSGSRWGESAVKELDLLLPKQHKILNQQPLVGSQITTEGDQPTVQPRLIKENQPSNFVIVFGSRINELATAAEIVTADLAATRSWESSREASLAWLERRLIELEDEVTLLRAGGPIPRSAKGNGSRGLVDTQS